MTTLKSGVQLGPYEVQSLLGVGGMGEVYRATDTRLERTVAIKILPVSVAFTPARRRRWERETRAISALSHPHICALYDVGEHDGIPFIVMEYLDGETLAHQLARGPLPISDALRHAVVVADALSHAHRVGVIHRDLKPANIMVTKSGAKLLDFGLAAWTGADRIADPYSEPRTGTETLTEEGTILGTMHYMAPEQLEGRPVDARADIFAFGAVLYEMLTGQRAFDGASRASVIAAVLEREPRSISLVRQERASADHVTPLVEQIVARCLAKSPDERWQGARDLHAALRWLLESGMPSTTQAAQTSAPRSRVPQAWIAASLVAIAVMVALALATARRTSSEAPGFQFTVPPPEGTAFNAANSFMSLSPDGRTLAFSASSPRAEPALWIRSLDSVAARLLPGTAGAVQLFWSADSRSVAFTSGDQFKTIEVATGRVRTLGPGAMVGTWNSDGVIVTRKGFAGPEGQILWLVPANGGEWKPASARGRAAAAPEFLPDGRRFLFVGVNLDAEPTESRTIYGGSLDSLESRPLFESDSQAVYAPPGYVLYMRGFTLVAQRFDVERLSLSGDPIPIVALDRASGAPHAAFSVSQTGVLAYRSMRESELVWFDRNGTPLGTIGPPAHYANPALSPDARHLAVQRLDPSSARPAVWLVDLASGEQSRFTSESMAADMPLWTADGRQITYRAERAFYRKAIGADAREELLISGLAGMATPLGWTDDHRTLIFDDVMSASTMLDLHLFSLDRPQERTPWLQTSFSESQGQLSPDGRWMAYVSNNSGTNAVYVRPFPAGDETWLITPDGGLEPRWRPDGKELFYLARDRSLMAVSVKTSPAFEAGRPVRLFQTRMSTFQNGWFNRNQYVVSPDGRILINQPREGTSAITVVTNWTARLPSER